MTNKDQQIIEEQRAIQRLRQWSGMRYGKDSNDVHYDTRHLLCAYDRLYEEHKRYREASEKEQEWFFRWAARAKAESYPCDNELAINMIWEDPANPYKENNPWG